MKNGKESWPENSSKKISKLILQISMKKLTCRISITDVAADLFTISIQITQELLMWQVCSCYRINTMIYTLSISASRCFIMPLNRGNVLPPSSLYDLVHKIWDGYYKVDTKVVRETMRVVTPPITNTSEIGEYIASECQDMPIYRLEKYVGGGKNIFWHTKVCTYIVEIFFQLLNDLLVQRPKLSLASLQEKVF